MVAQCVVDAGNHLVGAFICQFHHGIPGFIHPVGIVPCTAGHDVGPGHAVQCIVQAVPGDGVVQTVARTGCGRGIFSKRQVLHIVSQCPVNPCNHFVRAFTGQLHHRIPGIVHLVGIVSGTTGHGVRPGHTVQRIVQAVPGDGVVQAVARTGHSCGVPGKFQVFHIVREGVINVGNNGVGPLVCGFHNRILC